MTFRFSLLKLQQHSAMADGDAGPLQYAPDEVLLYSVPIRVLVAYRPFATDLFGIVQHN